MKCRLLLLTLLLGWCGPAVAAPLNVVVFLTDDLGVGDTQPYGSTDIRTPNVTQLAVEGMKFTRCFVASPSCGPSRTALLTGLMPAKNGAEPNHMPKRAGVASLPPVLHESGYEVAAFGKVAHGVDVAIHGFDLSDKDSSPDRIAGFFKDRDAAKPLCLFLGTRYPHVPWGENDGYDPAAMVLPPTFVDTPETRAMRTEYASDVTRADTWVGDLLAIVRKNLTGPTLILFSSDHGAQWPFGKWNLYDASTRVPFIAVWPDVVKPGTVSDAFIQWTDILPTLIDLTGGKVPEGLDGKSFAGLLRGETTTHRDRIFTTHSGDGGRMNVYPIRALRDGQWKYIRNLHPEYQHHSHIDRAGGKDGLIYWESWLRAATTDPAAKWTVTRHVERPAEELYDIPADPDELKNVAALPENADRLAGMRSEMDAWLKAQGDELKVYGTPLLLGEPAPPFPPAEKKTPAGRKAARKKAAKP